MTTFTIPSWCEALGYCSLAVWLVNEVLGFVLRLLERSYRKELIEEQKGLLSAQGNTIAQMKAAIIGRDRYIESLHQHLREQSDEVEITTIQ